MGRTQGDEETWVKSSSDRKLALHIGCAPNAKEYPHCCLPVISSLHMALAHAHTCIQSLTRKLHFHQPELNSLQPTSGCGLASTRLQLGFIKRDFSVDTCNRSWTRVQPRFKLQCGHAFIHTVVILCLPEASGTCRLLGNKQVIQCLPGVYTEYTCECIDKPKGRATRQLLI